MEYVLISAVVSAETNTASFRPPARITRMVKLNQDAISKLSRSAEYITRLEDTGLLYIRVG